MQEQVREDDAKGSCGAYVIHAKSVEQGRRDLPTDDSIEDVCDLLKLIGNPTRLKIILALAKQELCVCDLSVIVGISVSAMSRQLQSLRAARLIQFRNEGKLAFYSLRDRTVLDLIERIWPDGAKKEWKRATC